jgi:uncharacterized protein
MILKSVLEVVASEQLANLRSDEPLIERELAASVNLSAEYISIITGIRRCGKSTLMQSLMKELKNDYAYFNFEDPRIFGFEVHDFSKLHEVLGEKQYYFFDEIQNIENWELYIRQLHDRKKTVCITGSNASLLSKELGTRLTGRNLQKELFPFTYKEFCDFSNENISSDSVTKYLDNGGFPSFLKTGDVEYLQQLFKDILHRDIIVRYGIRNVKLVEGIALFLISNIGKEYSLNGIKKTFNVGSVNSVADYVAWFEDAYLLFSLPRFSWSLKSVAVNPKKIYTIDTGFARANSLSFSKDIGRLFENMIYLALRRKEKNLFYFKETGECDFVIKKGDKVIQLVQVCYDLNNDNLARETNGLMEAMEFFELKTGVIVTLNQNDVLVKGNKTINVISADKWLSNL